MNKTKSIIVITLLLFSLSAFGQAPRLENPVPIRLADGSILDVGNLGYASVNYRDMDDDGVPDLLVGELSYGGLRVYHNQGTETEPVFTELEQQGREELQEEGLAVARLIAQRSADMRYAGQSYTLNVPWSDVESSTT
ncbi:MAG: hypothetical protein MI741_11810, partial [Rhodospirillales bacterium]|nr:hypothetical protein [Rhodospirillales bacterium]